MSQTATMMFDQERFAVCQHCGAQIRRASVGAIASEVWHEACWNAVHAPIESGPPNGEPSVVPPAGQLSIAGARELPGAAPRRRIRLAVASASAVAVASALAITCWFAASSTVAASPSLYVDASEPVAWMDVATRREVPNAAVDPMVIHKIPTAGGISIVERYPTLATWIHPVVNTDRSLPELPSGGFGAERDGRRRHECGRGHCGSDINGPIGRPIVAVADGIISHVEWSRQGKDRRSGRYVQIEHADGTHTYYMHLHTIIAGLERGDRVLAGQQIGLLGRTGIRSAAPHLHFALAVPNGKGSSTRYVDPAPYLLRAKVIDVPDRRRPEKPAW